MNYCLSKSKKCLVIEICVILFTSALECWKYGLDVLYKTEIYARHLTLFVCKYYIIEEKYFYFLLMYLNAVLSIGSLALVAASTMIFSYIKHICGIFRIAR